MFRPISDTNERYIINEDGVVIDRHPSSIHGTYGMAMADNRPNTAKRGDNHGGKILLCVKQRKKSYKEHIFNIDGNISRTIQNIR